MGGVYTYVAHPGSTAPVPPTGLALSSRRYTPSTAGAPAGWAAEQSMVAKGCSNEKWRVGVVLLVGVATISEGFVIPVLAPSHGANVRRERMACLGRAPLRPSDGYGGLVRKQRPSFIPTCTDGSWTPCRRGRPATGSDEPDRRALVPVSATGGRQVCEMGSGPQLGIRGQARRARWALRRLLHRVKAPAAQAAGLSVVRGRAPSGWAPRGGPPLDGQVPHDPLAVDVADFVDQGGYFAEGEEEEDRPRRVLILMSDTGGGHRASAEALEAAFDELYPGDVEVSIVDVWTDYTPWPFNGAVESYQFMAKHPPIWRAFWEYGRFPITRFISERLANIRCHQSFRRCIEDHSPDLVVSVHPLCQDLTVRILKNMKKEGGNVDIPFVTVVTDLGGAHPTWFHRDVDKCFVPSEALRRLALKNGLAESQIQLHGLPIRPGFWEERTTAKQGLQEKLGLKPGVKTCLVVGGGDGVGGLAGIARSVGTKLGQGAEEAQVVVVCGKNQAARSSLEGHQWGAKVRMHVKGFVSNMDEWMGAVDCIVTKAGPGTIAEATTRGLPIMLSAFLPGQEAGNVPYVTEGGFGSFSRNPNRIAETVSRWLQDDDLLASMSSKAKEAGRPKATYDIARDIGNMLFAAAGRGGAPSQVALPSGSREQVPMVSV